MKPIEYIRKSVFKVSQAIFAEIAGTTQGSVSRWETGDQEPGLTEMESIRQGARDRGIAWDDAWFFEIPAETHQDNLDHLAGPTGAAA